MTSHVDQPMRVPRRGFLAALGIAAEEASLSPADLAGAREIFLTNSLFELRSLGRLDDREITGSEIAARLRATCKWSGRFLAKTNPTDV